MPNDTPFRTWMVQNVIEAWPAGSRGPRALLLVPPSPHVFLGHSRDAVDDGGEPSHGDTSREKVPHGAGLIERTSPSNAFRWRSSVARGPRARKNQFASGPSATAPSSM